MYIILIQLPRLLNALGKVCVFIFVFSQMQKEKKLYESFLLLVCAPLWRRSKHEASFEVNRISTLRSALRVYRKEQEAGHMNADISI